MAQGKSKAREKAGEKEQRRSLSVRLQPFEGSLLAEVVRYLNGLDRADAQRQIENVLVMALLAQARLYDEGCSHEERRRCCIEACDALDKHASMLRQLVGVEVPGRWVSAAEESGMSGPVGRRAAVTEAGQMKADGEGAQESVEEDEVEAEVVPPKARIPSKASAAAANALFGD